MTKFKEYLRAKGIKLECDFEVLPYNGIDGIMPCVMENHIVVCVYHESLGDSYKVVNRYGECDYYNEFDYHAHVDEPQCAPRYIDFLFDTGCNKAFDVFDTMRYMYLNDAKVRIAFKHMEAGIMDYMVFYKWISDRYQTYINS